MVIHWRTLPFLLAAALSRPLFVLAAADKFFENTAIVRTIELGGSNVHVTTTYAVRALEAGAQTYTLALSDDERDKTSWLEVRLKGQQTPLAVKAALGVESGSHSHLYYVQLPKALDVNGTANIILDTVQTHATYPWPDAATQTEEQSLKYHADLLVLSPYHTLVQRTKLRAPSPRILSYTTPSNLEAYTLDNVVTKSGATITYGPFNNVPPSTTDGFTQHPIVVHFHLDEPMLTITTLKRAAEISHWGANLNIQDEIHLHNAGPKLKGHFSRVEHQMQTFYHSRSPQVLRELSLLLPAGVENVYFYDLNGNVSTSHLRVAPSVPKYASSGGNKFSVLELRPRYPLMGGWNYSFTLGWDSPLGDSVSWNAKEEKYIAAIPVMTLIAGSSVDEAEVQVILPEGATDVEVFQPFPAVSITRSIHTTFLDTVGRPTVIFQYRQLTDKHLGTIYVSYKVPLSAHLKKPIAVATAFMFLFTLALGGRRVDMRIHKK